jgi:hypothetical protein
MMKIKVDSARVDVSARFSRGGALLNHSVFANCVGVDVQLYVDSLETPERVSGLLRNAEAGCYVMQALANPTPVTATFELNGVPIEALAPSAD